MHRSAFVFPLIFFSNLHCTCSVSISCIKSLPPSAQSYISHFHSEFFLCANWKSSNFSISVAHGGFGCVTTHVLCHHTAPASYRPCSPDVSCSTPKKEKEMCRLSGLVSEWLRVMQVKLFAFIVNKLWLWLIAAKLFPLPGRKNWVSASANQPV